MQPKNKAERRRAFTNFLLLFLVCTGIIITTVFFSFQVPFKQNDQLRKQMEDVEKERDFSKRFTTQLVSISRMLDSINSTQSPESDRLDAKIKDEISKLDLMINDSVSNKELYLNSTHNLGDMQTYLKQLREKTGNDVDVNGYKQEVKEAQTKAQEYYTKYLECLTKK